MKTDTFIMSMFKCTTDKYDRLYIRWLKNPGSLLDFGRYNPKTDVLYDLCGGTGVVALEALKRGAEHQPVLIDLNPRCPNPEIVCITGDVQNPEIYPPSPKPSLCVIRQALGYLDMAKLAATMEAIMPPGARLVFNNFMYPRWKFTTYKEDGDRFVEVAGYLGNQVGHVQYKLGEGFDMSFFKHHSMKEIFKEFLDRKFTYGEVAINKPSARITMRRYR